MLILNKLKKYTCPRGKEFKVKKILRCGVTFDGEPYVQFEYEDGAWTSLSLTQFNEWYGGNN